MIHSRISAIVLLCTAGLSFAGAAAGQAQRPINSYIVQVAEGFEPAQVGRGIAQRTGGGLGGRMLARPNPSGPAVAMI